MNRAIFQFHSCYKYKHQITFITWYEPWLHASSKMSHLKSISGICNSKYKEYDAFKHLRYLNAVPSSYHFTNIFFANSNIAAEELTKLLKSP